MRLILSTNNAKLRWHATKDSDFEGDGGTLYYYQIKAEQYANLKISTVS